MFKKLILIALCSVNLCAAESSNKPMDIMLSAYFFGVMVPKELKSPELKAKYKESTIERLKIANAVAQIALGIYCVSKLVKGFYDYCYPNQMQEAIAESTPQLTKLLQAQRNLETCLANKTGDPASQSNDCHEQITAFVAALRK